MCQYDDHVYFDGYLLISFRPANSPNKPFSESVDKLLILKGCNFSGHGLGVWEVGRGTESIRQFREYSPKSTET
jgi:hypothetical protein